MRYVRWPSGALRGDLGDSYRSGNSIAAELTHRLPATLTLAAVSLALAVATGIPLGVLAAMNRGSWLDTASRLLALLGAAVPSFVLAFLLMLLFAVKLDWLPATGYGSPKNLALRLARCGPIRGGGNFPEGLPGGAGVCPVYSRHIPLGEPGGGHILPLAGPTAPFWPLVRLRR